MHASSLANWSRAPDSCLVHRDASQLSTDTGCRRRRSFTVSACSCRAFAQKTSKVRVFIHVQNAQTSSSQQTRHISGTSSGRCSLSPYPDGVSPAHLPTLVDSGRRLCVSRRSELCHNWNSGGCVNGKCPFGRKHQCTICGKSHRASDCRDGSGKSKGKGSSSKGVKGGSKWQQQESGTSPSRAPDQRLASCDRTRGCTSPRAGHPASRSEGDSVAPGSVQLRSLSRSQAGRPVFRASPDSWFPPRLGTRRKPRLLHLFSGPTCRHPHSLLTRAGPVASWATSALCVFICPRARPQVFDARVRAVRGPPAGSRPTPFRT